MCRCITLLNVFISDNIFAIFLILHVTTVLPKDELVRQKQVSATVFTAYTMLFIVKLNAGQVLGDKSIIR